jgi:putative hydrolase of the HAD superfamily
VRGLVDAYRKHRPRISLLPDAREALARIRRFALLTDGPAECQRNKVRALGLAARAEIVVLTGAYGAAFGKPHPRGFQEIADRSAAGRLVYVADNPVKDFIVPRRLGWTTVRVRRPGGLHARVAHGDDVDVVVEDLSELPAFGR